MTGVQTAKILTVISAVHQNFTVNQFQQNIWHELLKDLDYQYVSVALKELLRSSKFVPTPAEIIEKARVVRFLSNNGNDWQWLEGGDDLDRIGDKNLSGSGQGHLSEACDE